MLLQEIFEARAEARPDDPAVVFGSLTASYGELNARANRLARHLRSRGVGRGSAVAMLLPRSIDAYASILAILKAGAAYVPIDPEYPADRIAWILEDSAAAVLATTSDLADRCPSFPKAVVLLDTHREEIARENPAALPRDAEQANPRDLCYVIYTSGSTGRPKGVAIEHRSACHLVETERSLFGVNRRDRVYQGASLSFDLSVEEMWLAFAAGATLIAATCEMSQAGPDLWRHLAAREVTVLSCVPSLLCMLEEADLPALRLIILGGETCPGQLVERWARAGRRIVNTYGPTEATVIATYADLFPGRPVTIGRPLPGYRVYLLDDDLRPVASGQAGEICIGGSGVARGYLNLPAETAARFVPDPFETAGTECPRMYRSGDLGRMNDAGDIEFQGRADGQVKLRGLRVELGEIESALLRDECVRAAVCAVRKDASGHSQIVARVTPRTKAGLDEEHLRAQLRKWLPAWMVPSLIESLDELPRLAGGKIDRAALPEPRARRKPPEALLPFPKNGTESRLAEVWSELFYPAKVARDDDFFLDLGGHSLLAAWMVSELRKSDGPSDISSTDDAKFAALTVRDVYQNPTIAKLAAVIDSRLDPAPGAPAGRSEGPAQIHRLRHFMAGAMQTSSLYFVFAFRAVQWITPWLVYFLLARHHARLDSAIWAVAAGIAVLPLQILMAVGAKWAMMGRVKPGRHPLWGAYYVRWWFVQTLIQSVPLKRLGGTPLLPLVYRLLGARIGRDVHIATDLLAAFDVISIGDGASIDEGASLLGYTVEGGDLVIGPVTVGRRCLVGTRSVLCPGAAMEDGARLEDLSLLPEGTRIPAGETWSGSPARRGPGGKSPIEQPPASHRAAITLLYAVLVAGFPLLELAAFLPGVTLLTHFDPGGWLASPFFYLAAPVAGASFIVTATAEVVLLKWLLIGRARAGRYPVHGWFYVRNWVVEQLLALSLDIAGPLHATLFLKPWYRALGAKLGRFAEVSTASATTPDLLDIGDDCTVADEVSLGAARVENGWLTLAPTKLGRRAFVGNSAVIPAGTTMGDKSLVGVLTIAPSPGEQAGREEGNWLGSPPLFLPRRQPGAGFPEQSTFRPPRRLQWARACWETLRITLPGAGMVLATVAVLETALRLWDGVGPAATLLWLPLVFATSCAALMLAVVPVKWLVVGRYKPFEKPFWSAFLWRLELVNALFEFMATPLGLDALRGTPLLAWYLRLLGCRIGRGVYIDSTGFLEFDLTEVGDGAILNKDCILQTHLFEDRVLKGAPVRIGPGCEIGTQSIVLRGAEMKERARIGSLSLLMKGETLPAGQVWMGSPLESPARTEWAGSAERACDLVA